MGSDEKQLATLMKKYKDAHALYAETMRLADKYRAEMDKLKTRIQHVEKGSGV